MSLYSYEIGTEFTATGTVVVSSGSKAVAGTGTVFTTEFDAGDLVIVSGQYRIVDSITNNTTMAVTNNWTSAASGVAFAGSDLANIEDLGGSPAAPRSSFVPHSRYVPLGDGTVRGSGWATGEWRWGYLTQAQRNALRAYCTGASAEVYVRTRENDTSDAYQYYSATMVWPQEEGKTHGYRTDFVIAFQNMTELSIS